MKSRVNTRVCLALLRTSWGIALALPFSSCAKKDTSPPTPAPDIDAVTSTPVKVGFIPITECAHLYVGIAKQFFAAEGLDVQLQPMKGGAVILPALQKGDLDIGFANVVSLIAIDSGIPPDSPQYLLSLTGASYERPGHSNHALLVKQGSTLTVKDLGLPSTRLAINTTRNIEELMLRRYIVKQGLSDDHLNVMTMGFPDMNAALQRGDVDVIAVVEPFIEPAVRSGNCTPLARQYLDVSTNTVVATYAVTRQWLQRNPATAAKFSRAFKKAAEFMKANDAETRDILGSFTRISQQDLSIVGMPAFEERLSQQDMKTLSASMLQFGFLKSEPDLSGIIASP